ncbi:uncharacterized protein PFLUO_LOCUS1568 [Penicillium psychrofluorescens]|uniref:uncharacterized protein n=1 Tax=Penicillium psychrofluorescens TaxID=3158075 RepID=UPI003CCE0C73
MERSYDTVLPLALDLGLDIDTSCSRNDVECVAETVLSYEGPGNMLICWRHGRMREIEMLLGVLELLEYPSNRFDLIWTTPYPYNNITDVRDEECPGLDVAAGLVVQG